MPKKDFLKTFGRQINRHDSGKPVGWRDGVQG